MRFGTTEADGRHGSHREGGLRAALAIARRDLLEFVRDRRTLFITLLLPMATYPIVALASALGLRTAMSDIEARQIPVPVAIALSGGESRAFAARVDGLGRGRAGAAAGVRPGWPSRIDWKFNAKPEDAVEKVILGQADLWIDVPRGVFESLDRSGTVTLEIHLPASRPGTRRARDHVAAVMRSLADDARQRRITAAGLPPSTLEPLRVKFSGETTTQAGETAESILPRVAGAILVLLAVLTMTGAFYPAIDAIAGEKERGTIETLLIAPCGTRDIVFGKFLAVYAVTLATLAANVVSIVLTASVTKRFLPAGGGLPLRDLAMAAGVTVLAFAGLAALAAATCLAVTTASKSTKEAQNTLTPVILLVSALAGVALMPGMRSDSVLSVVPFAGQVIVGRAAVSPDDDSAAAGDAGGQQSRRKPVPVVPLALTLLSSGCLTWLLLRGTAAMLVDEELLFRGPDAAGGLLSRPARRRRPSMAQGIGAVIGGFAAIWYGQGIAPRDLALAIPLQQAALLLPLGVMLWWQRVDLRSTFGLRWPGGRGHHGGSAAACLIGGGLIGAGVFVVGAAVLLAMKGTGLSADAKELSQRLVALMRAQPWWLSWSVMALLPAVCEELFFRGWVQSALAGPAASRGRAAGAVVAQAAAFALFHLLPERMPQTFVLGIVLGWITLATGSLLPAIVCHTAHNSMPLLLLAALTGEPAGAITGIPAGTLRIAAGCVAAGVLLVALGRRGIGSWSRTGGFRP